MKQNGSLRLICDRLRKPRFPKTVSTVQVTRKPSLTERTPCEAKRFGCPPADKIDECSAVFPRNPFAAVALLCRMRYTTKAASFETCSLGPFGRQERRNIEPFCR